MDEVQRFTAIQEKANKASETYIRLEERLKTNMVKLDTLVKSIQEKGYDPNKLAEIKAQKTAELTKALDTLETELNTISEQLKSIEEASK
jgi:DNA repair exonuclease SbcCD ATPase subunit